MRKSLQLILLLRNIITGILAPVLTLALLRHGAVIGELSLLVGVYTLTVIVMEFPTGLYADLYGRKSAFLISCVCGALSYGILLLARRPAMLAVGMVASGVSRAYSSGSLDALAVDDAPDEAAIGRVSARLNILESVGLAVGALGGGLLAGIGTAYEANLGINLLISALLFPLTLLTVHEKRTACMAEEAEVEFAISAGATPAALQVAREGEAALPPVQNSVGMRGFLRQARQSLAFVVHSRIAKALFLLAFATGVSLAAVETYWQPALSTLSPAPWLLGAFSFLGFAGVILGSAYTERRMAKHPRTGLGYLLAQKSLMALCMALLILPSSAGAYLGVYICIYLFLGCGSVAETTLLNREAPSAQRAGILSLYSFTLQAGGLVSALMGYLIATRADFRLTWIVGAAVMLAAVAMIAMRRLRREQA